jgi:nucleoside-diphosphate-sugar epimerase
MRALVTGAGGFIGRWSAKELKRLGFEVHAVVSPRQAREPLELAGSRVHALDLFDAERSRQLIEEVAPSHLLHLAWVGTPGVYWHSPDNQRWLDASMHLAECFHSTGGRRLVAAGTCAEYDWTQAGICREAVTPKLDPEASGVTPYQASKGRLHRFIDEYAKRTGVSCAWGHVFFQYGPYEYRDRLVSSVMVSLLEGREALCSSGRQVRAFLHSKDVGSAFAQLLASKVEGPVNVASGQATSVRDLVMKIGGLAGRAELIKLGARSGGEDPPLLTADVSRLTDEVGFTPAFTLDSGLADTLDWWRRELKVGS